MKHCALSKLINFKDMTNKTTTTKFNVSDIVTIASDYAEFAKLDIAQPQILVYSVMSVNTDGTITLAGIFSDIPTKYVVGVPV
jgi:repressor of nif and glnA expression